MNITYNWGPALKAVDEGADREIHKAAGFMLVHCQTSHVQGWGRRTGTLMRSYAINQKEPGTWEMFTAGVPYAKFVEKGTSHMPAQEHMLNAALATASRYGGELSVG